MCIIRESGQIEHYVNVMVSTDQDDDLVARVMEDVPEKFLTVRRGEPEIEFTGSLFFYEGEEIELTDEEVDEAREAMAANQRAWEDRKAGLLDHLKPKNR